MGSSHTGKRLPAFPGRRGRSYVRGKTTRRCRRRRRHSSDAYGDRERCHREAAYGPRLAARERAIRWEEKEELGVSGYSLHLVPTYEISYVAVSERFFPRAAPEPRGDTRRSRGGDRNGDGDGGGGKGHTRTSRRKRLDGARECFADGAERRTREAARPTSLASRWLPIARTSTFPYAPICPPRRRADIVGASTTSVGNRHDVQSRRLLACVIRISINS